MTLGGGFDAGSLFARLGAKFDDSGFDKYDRAVDKARRDTDRMERDVSRSTGRMGSAWGKMGGAAKAGALGGVAAVGLALKASVQAAVEAEKSQARLTAQLAAQDISYAKHRDEIERVIQSHSRLSGLDDEDLQDAFTNIVRVTGDVDKSLRLTGLAADFARAKHMDVAKAGELVGKVAGGNVGILGRYGIQVKKGATETEALALLQSKFAGQAEAYGKTTAGASDRMKVALENAGEALGAKLTPHLAKAAEWVTKFIGEMESGRGAGGKFARTMRNIGRFIEDYVVPGIRLVIRVAQRMGEVFGDVIAFQLRALDKWLGVISSIAGKFTWLPKVGGEFRKLQESVDGAREKIRGAADKLDSFGEKAESSAGKTRGLGRALDALKPKNVKVKVGLDIFIPGGSSLGKMPGGDGWGVDAASAAFAASIDEGAASLVRQAGKRGELSSLIPAVSGSGLNAFNGLAQRFGVSVGSGVRPGSITSSGNLSWHARGRARDFPGPAGNMMRFAQFLASVYGPRLLELIYTPLGFSIKNGQRVAPYAQKDHYDHVHVAMQKGGRLDRPTVTLAGEDAPVFPEFYISTNPIFRNRSVALMAEAARRIGGRFEAFRGGGIKGGRGKIKRLDAQIEKGEREYSRADSRFNLTDEDFITEDVHGDPILDVAAITRRAGAPGSKAFGGDSELERLLRRRSDIRRKMRMLETAIKRLRSVLKAAADRIKRSIPRKVTKKNRKRVDQLRDRYRALMDERSELGARLPGLRQDILDQDLDVESLEHEIRGIRGTQLDLGALPKEGDPPTPINDALDSPTDSTGGGITAEQQQALDNAAAITARFNEVVGLIGSGNLINRQLEFVGGGSGDIGTAAYRSAFGAAAEGAFGTAEPLFQAAPQIIIQTLHPADPETLKAIGDAATAGMNLQGSVQSPREYTGL